MSETENFRGNIKWLGWDKPVLKLLEQRLLALPTETLRRATLVVPTSGSGRRLKEYMAQKSKVGVLMPKVVLVTELLRGNSKKAASAMETRAAWVEVLTALERDELREEGSVWQELFPRLPQGDVYAWAHHAAEMLCSFRKTMEQECVDDAYVQMIRTRREQAENKREAKLSAYFARLDTRWELIHELFERVDSLIGQRTGKKTQEQQREELVANPPLLKGLLIFACVPEVSRQTRLFLQHYAAKGGKVEFWVNAPESQAALFDAFGQPLTEKWLTRRISFPPAKEKTQEFDEDSCLHLVRDAKAMGRKAVELCAEYQSADVALISCDTAMEAAVTDAFAHPEKGSPWQLYLPAGRSPQCSPVMQLLPQWRKAVQQANSRPLYQEETGQIVPNASAAMQGLEPLLRNPFLQLLYVVQRQSAWEKKKMWSAELKADCLDFLLFFNRYLDDVNQICFPDSADALLKTLANAPLLKKLSVAPCRYLYADYIRDTQRMLHKVSEDIQEWKYVAERLFMLAAASQETLTYVGSYEDVRPLQFAACQLAETISEILECAAHFDASPEGVFAMLMQMAQQQAKALTMVPKEDTHADLLGWKEASFTSAEYMVLCGMHGGCLPEPVATDAMLPNTLRLPIGMTSAESREARDAFLYTALLNSRAAGNIHVVVAQQQNDGTPISPSVLLLHCGDDLALLARRSAYLFGDAPVDAPEAVSAPEWILRRALPSPDEGMESISQLGETPYSNPYADESRPFSPSSIRSFLTCPLRFWMKNLLKLDAGETYATDKLDMDVKEYGTLMHDVLKNFTQAYPDLNTVEKGMSVPHLTASAQAAVCAFLQQRITEVLNAEFRNRFGACPSFAIEAQRRMMTASLHAFAAAETQNLLDGWVNVFCEIPLTPSMQLQDGSVARFNMTADRIDYHPVKGWRIIDYKSNDPAPDSKYYAKAEKGDAFDRLLGGYFPLIEENGKCFRWTDIQLPLYALGLHHLLAQGADNEDAQKQVEKARLRCPQAFGQTEQTPMPELCYINIPKTKISVTMSTLHTRQKTGKVYITPLTEEYLGLAENWVKNACYLMRRGLCLYSAESLETGPGYGDFSAFVPEGDPRALFGLPSVES